MIDAGERLKLVEADLLDPEAWPAAVSGCTYVCHVASPFVVGVSEADEDILIKPAVEGTMNVLKPSKADKVKYSKSYINTEMLFIKWIRYKYTGWQPLSTRAVKALELVCFATKRLN